MPSPGVLILICGLPGSGKSTLARRLEVERNAIRLCPDEWIESILEDPEDTRERDRLRDPVEDLQWDLTLRFLRQGFTVLLEFGFWSEVERSLYSMEAVNLGASIELFYLHAPSIEWLWERVEKRNAELIANTWKMTRDELVAAWNLFEAPTPEEMSFYDASAVL